MSALVSLLMPALRLRSLSSSVLLAVGILAGASGAMAAGVSSARMLSHVPPGPAGFEQAAKAEEKPSHCFNEAMKTVPCPEKVRVFDLASRRLRSAFEIGDFARVEAFWDRWCTGKDRYPDGTWLLDAFTSTFRKRVPGGALLADDPGFEKLLEAWRKERPETQALLYVESAYLTWQAWKARGDGLYKTVSPEARQIFENKSLAALKISAGMIKNGTSCPAPYGLAVSQAISIGAPDEIVMPWFEEGIRRFPESSALFAEMARAFEPRWGGSEKTYEAFARASAEATRSIEGDGMYARIYARRLNESVIAPGREKDGGPDWKRLQAGFEDLLRRYPDSVTLGWQYAEVVCQTKNSALYRSIRDKQAARQEDPPDPARTTACDVRHRWQAGVAALTTDAPARRTTP